MAVSDGNLHGSGLQQIMEALRRLEHDPNRLARERRHFSMTPPPYSSGETTQPPSPPRPLSEVDRRMQQRRERMK